MIFDTMPISSELPLTIACHNLIANSGFTTLQRFALLEDTREAMRQVLEADYAPRAMLGCLWQQVSRLAHHEVKAVAAAKRVAGWSPTR